MGRSLLDVVLAGALASSLAVATGLVFAPELLPRPVLGAAVTIEGAIGPGGATALAVLVVAAFALWRSYASGATDVHDGFVARDPTEPLDTNAVVGAGATDRARVAIADLKRGRDAPAGAVIADLREALLAIETDRGCSREAAIDRIDRGAWTDDPVAAAFVGDAGAGRVPLRRRVVAWVLPGRTFERRLERTLDAIERHAAVPPEERGDSLAPRPETERNRSPESDATGTASEQSPPSAEPPPAEGGA